MMRDTRRDVATSGAVWAVALGRRGGRSGVAVSALAIFLAVGCASEHDDAKGEPTLGDTQQAQRVELEAPAPWWSEAPAVSRDALGLEALEARVAERQAEWAEAQGSTLGVAEAASNRALRALTSKHRAHREGSDPAGPPQADAGCSARCGVDDVCLALCEVGERVYRDEDGEVEVDCLVCGRETGFLGRPELSVAAHDDGWVRLWWTQVRGAAGYVVSGFRMDVDVAPVVGGSNSWTVIGHEKWLRLDPGDYIFYVVAVDADGAARGRPSRPVRFTR